MCQRLPRACWPGVGDAEDCPVARSHLVCRCAVGTGAARTVLAVGGGRGASPVTTTVFLAFAAFSLMYATANVVVFGVFGGFMTYPLLALVGNVRMLSSSASAYATRGAVTALIALPVVYVALVLGTVRIVPAASGAWRPRGLAFASLGAWLILGQYAFGAGWTTKQDRRIAENPHWVLLSSWWQVVSGEHTVRMSDKFAPGDLADFDPLGMQAPAPPSTVLRRISARAGVRGAAAPRPLNVVFVVLESVAARWAGLNGGPYDSTTQPESRIRARRRVRQLLRAHRSKLEFARIDAPVDVSEARLSRSDRDTRIWLGHLCRPPARSRLPHRVRHTERSGVGRVGVVPSDARIR